MAEADLDVVIRSMAKTQNRSLLAAAKKRHDRFMALAAKAKDSEARQRYRQTAKNTKELAAVAAKRLQNSADNAADSYARAVKRAAEEMAVKPHIANPVKPSPAPKNPKTKAKKPVKKASKG
jgi:hypothetical protein